MDGELRIRATVESNPQASFKAGQADAAAYAKGASATPGVIRTAQQIAATGPIPASQFFGSQQSLGSQAAIQRIRNIFGGGRMPASVALAMLSRGVGTPPVLPPTPPSVPPAQGGGGAWSGRAMSTSGISALSATGIPYVSTLARAVMSPLGAAASLVAAEFMVLRKTMHEYGDAVALYAKVLRSGGMSPSYVAGRSNLARVIGVGEQEVMNYAQAVEAVSGKVAQATRIQVEGMRTMTAAGWELNALQVNLKSVWTTIASDTAPAVSILASSLSNLTQYFVGAARGAMNLMLYLPGGLSAVKFASMFASPVGNAPAAAVSMNRTPTTAWERMGLSVGFAGGNPLAQTASNTRRTAEGVAAVKKQIDRLIETLSGALYSVGLKEIP